MTTYTKRDIRTADMRAMILFGFGVLLLVIAMLANVGPVEGKAMIGKGGKQPEGLLGLWVGAGTFLMLGGALNLKVRQLVRSKGREPVDYDGVPD